MPSNIAKISYIIEELRSVEIGKDFPKLDSALIINLMQEICELDSYTGILILWDQFCNSKHTIYKRTLTYILAKNSFKKNNLLWIPINFFIKDDFLKDQSSLINCLTAIQGSAIGDNILLLKILQNDLGRFLFYCLRKENDIILCSTAIETLIFIHEKIHIKKYLDIHFYTRIVEILNKLNKLEKYKDFQREIQYLTNEIENDVSFENRFLLEELNKEIQNLDRNIQDYSCKIEYELYLNAYKRMYKYILEKIKFYRFKEEGIKEKRNIRNHYLTSSEYYTPIMKSINNYLSLSIPLISDEITELHAARLLLLCFYCGSDKKIYGLTKLAKLDFFVRYPICFIKAANHLKQKVLSVVVEQIDSLMVRYHYGPWDKRYYQILAFLESRELISVQKKDNAYIFGLTEIGKKKAILLSKSASFKELVAQMKEVKKLLGKKSGNQLKNLVYEIFDEEVKQRKLGELIK